MTKIIKFIIISALLWATQAQAGPLFEAIEKGDMAEFSRLLENGADINERDEEGNTLLHHFAYWGQTETVTILLKIGVDSEARNENGATPLHIAALQGHSEAITTLLDAGAGIDTHGRFGHTPLHAAALGGHSEAITILLKAGADARLLAFGFTALDMIEEDSPLYKSPIWWRLRDAQFNGPQK